MIDILVISHACFRRVNRLVYNVLASENNISVHVIAPKMLIQNGIETSADKEVNGDVDITFKNLIGTNPRTYKIENTLELLDTLKPKMIYLDNDPVSFQAIYIGKWTKKNGSRLVCLSCENLPFDVKASMQRLGYRGLLTSIFKNIVLYFSRKNVDHVFAINNAGEKIFKKLKFKSVSLSPLGFDSNIFYPNPITRETKRKELSIEAHQVVIAYIGRTVFEKGIHILLESLAQLLLNKDWVLMLDKFAATKTSYQEKIIQNVHDLGLQDRVKYFDAPHEMVAQYMNAADVVVIPSISTSKWVEQYGRVAPEAMACGKLVLASNTGALPEIIGDTGLMFEESNTKQLSEILLRSITSYSDFDGIRLTAQKRALENYSINSQSNVILTKFKELVNEE